MSAPPGSQSALHVWILSFSCSVLLGKTAQALSTWRDKNTNASNLDEYLCKALYATSYWWLALYIETTCLRPIFLPWGLIIVLEVKHFKCCTNNPSF